MSQSEETLPLFQEDSRVSRSPPPGSDAAQTKNSGTITMTTTEKTITAWIDYARSHDMIEQAINLWLLWDFACGEMGDDFLRKHAREALDVLDGLDKSKPAVREVDQQLRFVIQSYLMEGT